MKKAFTLMELLVVIAIIGILASVIIVGVNSARQRGRIARIQSDVGQIKLQLESDVEPPALDYGSIDVNVPPYSTLEDDMVNNGASNLDIQLGVRQYYISVEEPGDIYFCQDSLGGTLESPVVDGRDGTDYQCP